MGVRARWWCAAALWCLAVSARASAYTVDCNHDYADCDTELSKLASDEEQTVPGTKPPPFIPTIITTQHEEPKTTTPKSITNDANKEHDRTSDKDETQSKDNKPQGRLLNLNVDDLQSFANALHNQSRDNNNKKIIDLSDVNLDDDEDEPTKLVSHIQPSNKHISDKFYTNLQAPFNPMFNLDKGSEESEMCRDGGMLYRIGDKIGRGCDEVCECTPGVIFDCTPRCKHPYIRRGRRLNDPLCFESPVDECCSIVACATGNGDVKPTKVEVCKYGNETYQVGSKWFVGCQQKCTCEPNSVVDCQPRCGPLPQSDKCINVQDPNDECCEVQICDVSQDVHEAALDALNVTSTTPSPTDKAKEKIHEPDIDEDIDMPVHTTTMRPLVLTEPIGSVKVLQNNSVQVNLMHMNNSENPLHLLLSSDGGKNYEDVELKYSNLILNLDGGKDYILKTRETGTKFNFTITAMDDKEGGANETQKDGCYQDGKFYAVGEEFHIGCSELCECTGADTRDCVELVCPSHVGLELMSKGCVRWAPSPPALPPNCCPRAARCLSDGTCHYKGIAVPNWSEVPIALTGCEERCFCENGELDCQEICTPLPPVPPQTLRCPPMHRPAPVNISDEDCCKQWGCIPNVGASGSVLETHTELTFVNYDTQKPYILMRPILNPTPTPETNSKKRVYSIHHFEPLHEMTVKKDDNVSDYSLSDPKPTRVYVLPKPIPIRTLYKQVDSPKHITHKPDKSEADDSYIKIEELTPSLIKPPSYKINDMIMHSIIQDVNQENTYPPEPPRNFQNFPTKDHMPSEDNWSYFRPMHTTNSNVYATPTLEQHKNYFDPSKHILKNYSHSHFPLQVFHKESQMASIPLKQDLQYPFEENTLSHFNNFDPIKPSDNHNVLFAGDSKFPLLNQGSSYSDFDTVELRPVQSMVFGRNSLNHPSSPLDLETMVTQMELESEVNRNLERSTKNQERATAGQLVPDSSLKPHPQQPSFLPTIPPEIHFPTDEGFDPNHLNRPVLEPVPPGLPMVPSNGDDNKKLTVISLYADSPTSVKMLFGLPPVLVGLRGSVDLRYTEKSFSDEDISRWNSQVFAPADEVLTTPRLEFRLTGLKPATIYRVRAKLFLHNLPVEPESEIYSIRTQDPATILPVEEKRKEINCKLVAVDVNDTSAHMSWRHFTEEELQFIDGIQVRYRPVGTPIYSMTELLHHSRSEAELHDLRPGTQYEASLILVPPPRATTELNDPNTVEFTTAPYVDPYNWTVTIEAQVVGSEAAELTWRGVPSPAERWVRVYRAAHACGASRREHDAFRLAARDLPPTILISGLESDTKCRVWLELFLTNGKVKTSNVLEINTKPQDTPSNVDNEIEASSIAGSRGSPRGDYYGALVVVGVVAALGALTSLLLLLILVRRHRPRSVPITPVPSAPRASSLPPYDNPAYKLELQQETMDL